MIERVGRAWSGLAAQVADTGYRQAVPAPHPSRPTRSILFDCLIALGVIALTALNLYHGHLLIVGVPMGLALLLRRRWPLPVMAVVAIFALVQVTAFAKLPDPLPFDVAIVIAMYSVVKYSRTVIHGYIAAAIVACGIAIETARHGNKRWWALVILYVGVISAVWLTAYAMRTRRAYVQGLEERAATLEREREHLTQIALAQERASIAREMHDVVAHSLAVIIVQADGGRYAMAADPQAARGVLDTIAATGRDALDDMRRLVDLLRGGAEESAPTADTARTVVGLGQLPALVDRARSAGLTIDLDCTGVDPAVNTALDVTAYRITQEALTNVLRHAGPRARVAVTLHRAGDGLRLSVVDDGGDGTPSTAPTGRIGHGIVGMRERVAVHGGTFTAGSQGSGWAVTAHIPAILPSAAHRLDPTAISPPPGDAPANDAPADYASANDASANDALTNDASAEEEVGNAADRGRSISLSDGAA